LSKIGILIASFGLVLPLEVLAQAPEREADKAEGIQRALGQRSFELQVMAPSSGREFFSAFLQDFQRLKNTELVEPDARSDRYDDPVWEPFRRRCTNVASELFDSYHCEPRNAEFIEQLPKEQRDELYRSSCEHYRGTTKFKHYRVDINNNPGDGNEDVFYHERSRGPLNRPGAQQYYASGAYSVIDFERCELKGRAEAHDPFEDSQPPRRLQNYSGVIKYRGKHYIFDLFELLGFGLGYDPKKPEFYMTLNGYAKFEQGAAPRLGPLCTYGTATTKRK